jgi:inner membrane transporter RhtA
MLSVQLGAALSTHLFDSLSPAGSAWVRVALAAVVLLALTRPRIGRLGWPTLRRTLVLGAATTVLMMAYIEAIARIPLGTTAAIEFLGPLGVAAARSHRRSALVWPALAFVGVLALTEPWRGEMDLVGIALAASAAAGWAAYIVYTQRVGAEVEGLQGLALSLTVVTVLAAPFAAPPALAGMTPLIALESAGLAVLMPLLPFSLELLALRRMRVAAFGTLMALEPGIATVIGLVVLSQLPTWVQAGGVLLVVLAGVGAQWEPGAARPQPESDVARSTAGAASPASREPEVLTSGK